MLSHNFRRGGYAEFCIPIHSFVRRMLGICHRCGGMKDTWHHRYCIIMQITNSGDRQSYGCFDWHRSIRYIWISRTKIWNGLNQIYSLSRVATLPVIRRVLWHAAQFAAPGIKMRHIHTGDRLSSVSILGRHLISVSKLSRSRYCSFRFFNKWVNLAVNVLHAQFKNWQSRIFAFN